MIDNDIITATPSPRKTYPQDWPTYNAAQTSEKETLITLLHDLCQSVEQPEYQFGRPGLPLSDMVFVSALKVYSLFSARRFDSDVRTAFHQGFTSISPSFTSVNRYIAKPLLTPLLRDLIHLSSEPLQIVDVDFAADSSGFSTQSV